MIAWAYRTESDRSQDVEESTIEEVRTRGSCRPWPGSCGAGHRTGADRQPLDLSRERRATGEPSTVQYAELVRLSGEITNGQPNQPVELTVTPYRGETRVVSLRTDSSGDFSWTHRPTIRTGYTASVNGRPATGNRSGIPRPKVGLRVISARRGLFRVTLAAQAQHVSRVVTFQRRLRNGQWAKVGGATHAR